MTIQLEKSNKTIRRIVIFANGQYRAESFYQSMIETDDYLICADGGADAAVRMGFVPHEILGDLDSVSQQVLGDLKQQKTLINRYRSDKDESDLELAIDRAITYQPQEIMILGALGKRTDHCLTNLMLLHKPLSAGIFAWLCDETYEMFMIDDVLQTSAEPEMIFTLIPVTELAEKVSTEGLAYKLQSEDLHAGSSRGLSNQATGNQVKISLAGGRLLVIKVKSVQQ